MRRDPWIVEAYYRWLAEEAFPALRDQREFEGVLRELHDVPFYWTIWSDENRSGDARTFRQYEFLDAQRNLDQLDQVWLGQWATATPSVLEVWLGMARRWTFYFEGPVSLYFGHMFQNMGLRRYPGKLLNAHNSNEIRTKLDDWMSRQFQKDGQGSPFPVTYALDLIDMTKIEIWGQMNAYSMEHFQ